MSEILQQELDALPCELRLVITLAGLPVSQNNRLKIEELLNKGIDWDVFVFWLGRHGMVPLIHHNICQLDFDFIPEKLLRQLATLSLFNSVRASLQTDEIIRLTDLLWKHGIPTATLKGTILSSRIFGDLSIRQVGDIDLLVRQEHILDADAILLEDGYTRQELYSGLTPLQQRELIRSGQHIVYNHSWIVELHWNPPWKWVEPLQQDTLSNKIGVHRLRSLATEEQLLHLFIHGAKHGWSSLKWIADIHQILCNTPALDWRRFWSLSDQVAAQRMVLQGMLLADVLFDSPIPASAYRKCAHLSIPSNVLRTPFRYLERKDENKRGTISGINHMWYGSLLRKGQDRIWFLLKRAGPQPEDWKTLSLPDRLFPLYYFLRPWLWLWRKYKQQ